MFDSRFLQSIGHALFGSIVMTAAVSAQQAVSAVPSEVAEIRFGATTPVVAGWEHRPLLEPYIVAHPSDPRVLLAMAMIGINAPDGRTANAGQSCAAFYSADAGRSWARHEFAVVDCFDPWLAIAPDGRAVASMLAIDTTTPGARAALLVFHSSDGGRTWSDKPTTLAGSHDHPAVVADATGGPGTGWIYLTSSLRYNSADGRSRRGIYIARSRDGGVTFDPPVVLQPSNLFYNAEVPVVLPDGTLVVSFTDTSWGNDEPQQRRAWVVRSTDGGQTFSLPEHVDERCGPPQFALAAFAADLSAGQRRGRLYYACNQRGGDDVVLTVSDSADHWVALPPLRAAARDSLAVRHVRALALNQDGTAGVLWVDRFGVGSEPRCLEVYFAASLDGGRSFLPAHRLTEGRPCVSRETNGSKITAAPTGGDYYGLTAVADGSFRAMWSEPRAGGAFQLWTAPITVRPPPQG